MPTYKKRIERSTYLPSVNIYLYNRDFKRIESFVLEWRTGGFLYSVHYNSI